MPKQDPLVVAINDDIEPSGVEDVSITDVEPAPEGGAHRHPELEERIQALEQRVFKNGAPAKKEVTVSETEV